MRMEIATSRKVGRMAKGFTLVELLVAITIISILATIALVAGRGVQLDAQRSKTRSTIDKIQEVLIARWAGYLTQQIPLTIPDAAFERNASGLRAISAREMARVRLLALRDMQRMELPDRPGDLYMNPVPIRVRLWEGTGSDTVLTTAVERTASSAALAVKFYPGFFTGAARDTTWAATNANEELLYEIVASSMINGSSALELFRPSEIADTDGDGFREFIDAWGKPIAFIRWPAGYPYDASTGLAYPSLASAGPLSEVDPFLFDQFRDMATRGIAPSQRGRPSAGSIPSM